MSLPSMRASCVVLHDSTDHFLVSVQIDHCCWPDAHICYWTM